MSRIYMNKTLSNNAIATSASASILVGPICVAHYDHISIHIRNSATNTLYLDYRVSSDEGLVFSTSVPEKKVSNCSWAVAPTEAHVNNIIDVNSYNFLTIHASATANIGASQVTVMFTGKRN